MCACTSMHSLQKKAQAVLSARLARRPFKRTQQLSTTASSQATATRGGVGQSSQAALGWQQLAYAATLAQQTSACYAGWDNLADVLKSKQLQLQGSGSTYYTRWYVADGCIDASRLVESVLRGASSPPAIDASHLAAVTSQLGMQPPVQQRFIHLRGVAWSADDTDGRRVWRQLGRVWPRPFMPELMQPPGILVVHDGVGSMAEELYPQLEPFISSSPYPLAFVGHSLGGALGKLLMVQARIKQQVPPERLSTLSFGSPPVLAHRDGGGGGRVLQLLGLEREQCRVVVHENDPVPRALLAVDPAYRALLGLQPVRGLLQLREFLLGAGAPLSPQRFLFECMGDVLLLRSGAEGGLSVSLLDSIDEMEPLDLSLQRLMGAPMQAMRLWLDHHYVSYSQELEVAALLALQEHARALGVKL